jgi:predicted NBD/HSP70 family sugar kinase
MRLAGAIDIGGTGTKIGIVAEDGSIDGELLRYTGECAGDLGHIILDPKGRRCTCGARGCLEAMACAAALSERGYRMHAASEFREKVQVVGSSLDGWEAMVGAASLCLDPLA